MRNTTEWIPLCLHKLSQNCLVAYGLVLGLALLVDALMGGS